jgi:hypothetical protein
VVDIIEDETEYLIKVDLPEIKKEEVKVTGLSTMPSGSYGRHCHLSSPFTEGHV